MKPITHNNAQTWSPFDSSPIEIPIYYRPNHQFSPTPPILKNFSPVIEPSWNNSSSQSMMYPSWNNDLSSPSGALFVAKSPKPTQTWLENQRPAMLVNNMFMENMTRCMQQQQHQQQLLPIQFEASAFADLVRKHSHGTGVFHPPNPNFTNNIFSEMKTKKMQWKEEVEVLPLRNSYQVRENDLVKQEQKENSYNSLLVDINLPEEWTY